MALTYEQKYDIAFPVQTTPGVPIEPHLVKKKTIIAMSRICQIIQTEDVNTDNHEGRLRYVKLFQSSASDSLITHVLLAVLNDVNVESASDILQVTDETVSGVVDGTPNIMSRSGSV